MVSWALFCWLCPRVAISAPWICFLVHRWWDWLFWKQFLAWPPLQNHPKQNPSHTSVYTHWEKSPSFQGFMVLPACFLMVEASHPKYCLKHFSLPSHDCTGKLEQWPGHWIKKTASLKYSNSVILSTKTNAVLRYSKWKPAMLAEELVRVNVSVNTYLVKITMGLIFIKFQLRNRVKS